MGTINDYQYNQARFEGYKLSDQDVNSSDADITYFGYVNKEGDWYIMRYDKTVGGDADLRAYRYVEGTITDDYTTQWAAREAQTYADYEDTFK